MGDLAIEVRSLEPKDFFAGEFPTLTEIGTAGEAVKEHTLLVKDDSGKIVTATTTTKEKIVGISAAAAEKNSPVAFYMTGEFFGNALVLPDGITIDDIKDELRKLSIFLR